MGRVWKESADVGDKRRVVNNCLDGPWGGREERWGENVKLEILTLPEMLASGKAKFLSPMSLSLPAKDPRVLHPLKPSHSLWKCGLKSPLNVHVEIEL